MAERHPKVHVVVVDATTSSLLPQLAGGHLDLAVVNLPVVDQDLATEELFAEDHVLIAPRGHELFTRDEVSLAELADVPLLLEPQGTGFRDHLDVQAAACGVELVAQAEVDGMRLLASLAFQGFGAGIVPASAVTGGESESWRRIPVLGLARRAVGLARRRRGLLSAPARALRDTLSTTINGGEPEPGIHPTDLQATVDPGAAPAGDGSGPGRTLPASHAG
jgi:DNA-binding transcriptional LysR family regulator